MASVRWNVRRAPLGHRDAQYLAALQIELDYPARRTWRLIEWPHAGSQRSIHQFERIDPSKMIKFAEEVAIEVELLNAAIFSVSHVDYPLTVDLDLHVEG